MGVMVMKRMLIEDYALTIVAYLLLMISIVTINLINQPMLKLVSYIVLPISVIVTIYGVVQVNKTHDMMRSL